MKTNNPHRSVIICLSRLSSILNSAKDCGPFRRRIPKAMAISLVVKGRRAPTMIWRIWVSSFNVANINHQLFISEGILREDEVQLTRQPESDRDIAGYANKKEVVCQSEIYEHNERMSRHRYNTNVTFGHFVPATNQKLSQQFILDGML